MVANFGDNRGAAEPGSFVPIRDLDIVFISYDEPQADRHWMDLKDKRPDARRVHGVAGIDRAHKAAARAANSTHFLTVDGDTVVNPAFFDLVLDGRHLSPRRLITWPSMNSVNGLVYGNGSLKCWHRDSVLCMRTHEAAPIDGAGTVDFGRLFERIVATGCYSETRTNGTPEQAFRAGYREGVKLSLVDGRPARPLSSISADARRRLQLWCSLGADAEHGLWSMLGARLGCVDVTLGDRDLRTLNDYDRLHKLWAEIRTQGDDSWSLYLRLRELGDCLRKQLDLHVEELTAPQSRFHKATKADIADSTKTAVDVPYASASAAALDKLGSLHRLGHGVPKDQTEAVRFFALAEKLGSRNGAKNLALCYLDGCGVRTDRHRAVALLRKATNAGSADAPFHLAEVLRQDPELPAKADEIVSLLRLAGGRGYAPALRVLGRLLEAGSGVDQDLVAAADAYARASDCGDEEAERLLRRLRARAGPQIEGGPYPNLDATGSTVVSSRANSSGLGRPELGPS